MASTSQPATRAVRADDLRACTQALFAAAGLPEADAAIVADTLVEADLRNVRSHGVMRVPNYLRGLERGSIVARPTIAVVEDNGATAVVDGGRAMGQVAAHAAMTQAIERALAHGIGSVALRASNHCGAMAYWAMMAPPTGCIGLAITNAGINMAPTGGRDRLVGNNPMAIAVPTRRDWPMVLDMATSVAAGGKLDMAVIRGEPIPLGWALDRTGQPTTDARAARDGGSLLPVGGPKGYGLAVMLDVLAGVLSGGRFGAGLGSGGSGQFFLAIRVDRFMPLGEFEDRMDALIDQLHGSALAPGAARVYVAGEIEAEIRAKRLAEGVPIEQPILYELEAAAIKANVASRPSAWG
jgi:LDH2 family malate/lactate/ureidoglycolate dehydrogenase